MKLLVYYSLYILHIEHLQYNSSSTYFFLRNQSSCFPKYVLLGVKAPFTYVLHPESSGPHLAAFNNFVSLIFVSRIFQLVHGQVLLIQVQHYFFFYSVALAYHVVIHLYLTVTGLFFNARYCNIILCLCFLSFYIDYSSLLFSQDVGVFHSEIFKYINIYSTEYFNSVSSV